MLWQMKCLSSWRPGSKSPEALDRIGDVFWPQGLKHWVPSGKHTKNYGKSPFFMGKSTISMAIFNSYVSHYQRVKRLKMVGSCGADCWPGLPRRRLNCTTVGCSRARQLSNWQCRPNTAQWSSSPFLVSIDFAEMIWDYTCPNYESFGSGSKLIIYPQRHVCLPKTTNLIAPLLSA